MHQANPLISIIVPSFNQGSFIEDTLLSIAAQSYKNYEIIVIDGGSADDSVNVIRKHADKISYWISEKDGGQSEAINKGLKVAKGEIVTWLNSDDYYEPGTLATVIQLFESDPLIGFVHGRARLFGEKTKDKIVGPDKDLLPHEYLPYMRFPQPSSFFRKKYLDAGALLNEQLHYAMDFELVARAILGGALAKRTNAVLSHYRLHAQSKTTGQTGFAEEWSTVLSGIFNSLDNGASCAVKLEALALVQKVMPLVPFEKKIRLSDEELEWIFLEHVHLRYHVYYRSFNTAACLRLSLFLKENYNSFYLKNKYYKYNFRLKFIPRFIIEMVRRRG
jgi:glycosyltransferase involved in cell wall biosynthesis